MCSVFRRRLALAGAALLMFAGSAAAEGRELRVCADPNNLPFSNDRLEGFENKIVAILADALQAQARYTWWAQRRGFVRSTLQAGLCDLVPGVLSGMAMLRTTRPYYRSTYVFVTRADAPVPASLDDPLLRQARIGVQLIGNEGSNTPPAHALSRRGIVDNVRGYSVYGDYREPNPPGRIIRAVAEGEIDVALAWGPLAGYFLGRESTPLRMTPVTPRADGPRLPMVFDISMGVRRDDAALRQEIDAALVDRRAEINAVLAAYGVPRIDLPRQQAEAVR
jgi:mxaJ protein